jgi:hypothetical protein
MLLLLDEEKPEFSYFIMTNTSNFNLLCCCLSMAPLTQTSCPSVIGSWPTTTAEWPVVAWPPSWRATLPSNRRCPPCLLLDGAFWQEHPLRWLRSRLRRCPHHGDLANLQFVAYYLKKGLVVAVATLNSDPVAAQFAEYLAANKRPLTQGGSHLWPHCLAEEVIPLCNLLVSM